MAPLPIRIGIRINRASANKSTAAIKTRIDKKTNGSAYGNPYLAPMKPVLHKRTKRPGANLSKVNLRRSPSGQLMI